MAGFYAYWTCIVMLRHKSPHTADDVINDQIDEQS